MAQILPPARSEMIDSLTGLRALACWAVVVYHFQPDLYSLLPALKLVEPLLSQGYLGPDVFFVLSGYVLCHRYASTFAGGINRRDLTRYVVLRFARIYPVHLLTLHVMVVLVVLAKLAGVTLNSAAQTRFDLWSYLENVFLIHAWFGEKMSWNYPAWSVSAEWFAYAFFPLVVVAMAKLTRARLAWVLGGAILLAHVVFELERAGHLTEVNLSGVLLRVSAEFLAGCLVHRATVLRPPSSRWWRVLPPLFVLVLVLVAFLRADAVPIVVLLVPLVVVSLAMSNGWASRLLSARYLVSGGTASYSVYLVHAIVLTGSSRATSRLLGTPLPVRIGYVAAVLVLVGVVGWLTYRLVEEPSRAFISRRGSRRVTRGAAVPHPRAEADTTALPTSIPPRTSPR